MLAKRCPKKKILEQTPGMEKNRVCFVNDRKFVWLESRICQARGQDWEAR